jgi:anti-repressor protein
VLIKLLNAIKKEREEKELLQNQIKKDKPKVIFANAVSESDETISIGDLAKILSGNGLHVGQNRLFEQMRMYGFLIKRGKSKDVPTQLSMDLNLLKLVETAYLRPNGRITISKITKVTGYGQQYFVNFFANKNCTLNKSRVQNTLFEEFNQQEVGEENADQ